MRKIILTIVTLFCFAGSEVFGQEDSLSLVSAPAAQSIIGGGGGGTPNGPRIEIYNAALPVNTCTQGSIKTFSYNNPNYTYNWMVWSVSTGSIVSTGGTKNSQADIDFGVSSAAYITISLHNGGEPDASNLVATISNIPIYVYTAGALTVTNSTVCAGTTMTVNCPDCRGPITWSSRPVGTSTWTSNGTTSGSAGKSFTFNQSTEVKITAGTCTSSPSTTTVNIFTTPNPGTIATTSYTVCSNTSPGLLGTAGSGGTQPTGTALQWQLKSGSTWNDISGATFVYYTPPALTATGTVATYTYRRKTTQCGNLVAYSSEITVNVHPASNGGTLTKAPTSTVCGSGSVPLILSGYTATSLAWKYRFSNDGGSTYNSWTDFSTSLASSVNSPTISCNGAIDRLYQFQATATYGVCSSAVSNILTVTAYGITAGTTSLPSPAPIGIASASGTVTVNGHSGSVIRWEQKIGSAPWSPLASTSTTYAYNNVNQTTSFRAVTQSATCAELPASGSTLTIFPINITTSDKYLPYGKNATITAQNNFTTYRWILNGVDILGSTAAASIYSGASVGTYQVRVTKDSTINSVPYSVSYTSASTVIQPFIYVDKAIKSDGTTADDVLNITSSTTILKEGVKNTSALFTLQPNEVVQKVTYSDGFGRPIQVIGIGQSPQMNDIVKPIAYNEMGQIEKDYLPYATNSKSGYSRYDAIVNYASSEQKNFYQNADKVANDNQPYAARTFEASMRGRVRERGAPGVDWQPGAHAVKNDFILNVANEVRLWKPDLTTNSFYPAKTLAVSQVTDENGTKVKTYTDRSGNIVLKKVQAGASSWLETYFIYDVYDRMICQLPPKATAVLGNGSSLDANSSSVSELIFKFIYDDRDRLTEKKVPGSAVQYFVYDKYDRLILSQDGNLRASGKWAFIKYDILDRPILSGILTDLVHTNLASMQSHVSAQLGTGTFYETRGTTLHGYTNVAYPIIVEGDLLTVNWYDNYDFDYDVNHLADYTYSPQNLPGEGTPSSAIGLPTGSMTKILGSSDYLLTVSFYDKFQRTIQTISNNHRRLTVDNLATFVYDFSGKLLRSKRTINTGTPVTIENKVTYDHAGRSTRMTQSIDGAVDNTVAKYSYNEIGQLIEKNLHLSQSELGLQSVDYRYNIRGWLSSINNSTLTDEGAGIHATNNDANDFFGMELMYNGIDNSLGNSANYDGSISAVKWKGPGASGVTDRNAYIHTYDMTGRLTNGQFKQYGTSAWDQQVNTLNEQIRYDENGNISNLIRTQNQRGMSGLNITSTPMTIDSLTYNYTTGNQLSRVEDASIEVGFANGTVNGTNEYTYNAVGSLTSDKNKGIDSIKYNDIGKVSRIRYSDGHVQIYKYSASGEKLHSKTFTAAGVLHSKEEYVNDLVFEGGEMKYLPNPEGRVVRYGQSVLNDDQVQCKGVTGFQAQNSDLSVLTQNGETYLKVIGNNSGQVGPGVFAGKSVTVQPNRKYLFKAKGYVQGTSMYQPTLFINSNTGLILFANNGPLLPKGAVNEDWISYEFTAPAGCTSVEFGVFWHNSISVPIGTEFYLNETDFKPVTDEYQYTIQDHQGNTRVLFTSIPSTDQISLGDMESETNQSFPNYNQVTRNTTPVYNSTAGGTYSNLLNGGYSGKIGLAKSYKVYPGDKLKIQANAKYTGNNNPPAGDMTGFGMAILSAFGLPSPVGGETGTASAGLNQYGTLITNESDPDSDEVLAYVNIILFDKDHHLLDVAYERIDQNAKQVGVSPVVTPDSMLAEYTVKEAGFAYMYVSNESAKLYDVYFDDIKMTYSPSNVIQYNEYYPFGMRAGGSWDRTESGEIVNRYLYNSASEFNSENEWYETMFRDYDPVLGRMNGVDVLAEDFSSLSPYSFAFNDPISFNDASGASPLYSETEMILFGVNYRGGRPVIHDTGTFGGAGGYGDHITPGSGGNWADGLRPAQTNFGLMSLGTFGSFYNLDLSNNQGKFEAGKMLGANVRIISAKDGEDELSVFGSSDAPNRAWMINGRLVDVTVSAAAYIYRDDSEHGDKKYKLEYWEGVSPYPTQDMGYYVLPNAPRREPFSLLEYAWNGGNIDGIHYDRQGIPMHHIVMGEAPDIGPKRAFKIASHLHHSFPKFLGGLKNQKLTKMTVEAHKNLHKELNLFLKQFGMTPSRANSGATIRRLNPRSKIEKVLSDFYNGPGAKYTEAAEDFFNQIIR